MSELLKPAHRAAFFGTGEMNARHARNVSRLAVVENPLIVPGGVEIVGSYSQRGRAWQNGHGATEFGPLFTNPMELVKETRPTMVWLAMSPTANEQVAHKLVQLDEPPNIFLEKPQGAGLFLPTKTAHIAAERGIETGVGFHLRQLEHVKQAKNYFDTVLTDEGRQVESVHMYWHGNSFTQAREWWRQRHPEVDGRVDKDTVLTSQIIEQGEHLTDLLHYIVGDRLGELTVDGGEAYYGIPDGYPTPRDVKPEKRMHVATQSRSRAHFTRVTETGERRNVPVQFDLSSVYQAPASDVGIAFNLDDGSVLTLTRKEFMRTRGDEVIYPEKDPEWNADQMLAYQAEDEAFVGRVVGVPNGGSVVDFATALRAHRDTVAMDSHMDEVGEPLFMRDFAKAS